MSNYKEGQIHLLSDALENKGEFTPDDVTLLGQATPEQLRCIRGYLRGTHKIFEKDYCSFTETALLRPVESTAIPARTKSFDPKRFYKNRKGLYVWSTFEECLDIRSREKVASAPERTYVSLELMQRAYDTAIRAGLPKHHLSTLEDIAALVEAQRGGKKGFLLNDGWANIFYVEGKNGEVFAVDVCWGAGTREWCVLDWGLDVLGDWNAGRRVLCPSNAVL